jgi:predicted enzyme related to lactoylglutathione lyase
MMAGRTKMDWPLREGTVAFSKINHVTIVDENYGQLSKFYEAVFGMRTSQRSCAPHSRCRPTS